MSLLEDVLQLLRWVLDYFGVPQEVLVPVWESTSCGQYRSVVRMIGTNLPLAPRPRLHFQVPPQAIRRRGHVEVLVESPAVPSLADVLWQDEGRGDGCTRFRSAVSLTRARGPQRFESSAAVPAAPDALQKILTLEAELLKLRAQIALIVTAPAVPAHSPPDQSEPLTPCFTPLSAPNFTSTPLTAPPPPPPPPPPAVAGPVQVSVQEVIRRRQAERRVRGGACEGSVTGSSAASRLSMLDVLRDLNQVKLRSVQRSPGGTPVRKMRSKGTACVSDPAALIAEALKRKFAHRRKNSIDKENVSAELSPFSSPDTPRVPQLTRRSQGRTRL